MSANNNSLWRWQVGGEDPLRREDWESFRKGLEYGPEKEREKEEATVKPDRQETKGIPDFSGLLQWIVIALIAVALIFVILRLLGIRNFNRRVAKSKYGFTQTQVFPDEPGDTSRELEDSVQDGDYRNAIRLLYLFVLRSFHEQGLLKWKKDKTNADYLRELRNNSKYLSFRKLTRIYEQVWYGESEINAGMYSEARTCYESLVEQRR